MWARSLPIQWPDQWGHDGAYHGAEGASYCRGIAREGGGQ